MSYCKSRNVRRIDDDDDCNLKFDIREIRNIPFFFYDTLVEIIVMNGWMYFVGSFGPDFPKTN